MARLFADAGVALTLGPAPMKRSGSKTGRESARHEAQIGEATDIVNSAPFDLVSTCISGEHSTPRYSCQCSHANMKCNSSPEYTGCIYAIVIAQISSNALPDRKCELDPAVHCLGLR